jgi:hypothetical protein
MNVPFNLDWVAILNENTELNLKNLVGFFEKKKGKEVFFI